ncbi:hypothetical protein BJ138DRAFT_425752 [Hygrophoropsis aurantiaca]|uniref:Uncharacterized protein n=1 Tax=Hygrophoropsis aurantiaca TaxID=72124 RepID=A0ACB8A4D5_9AGAM|nr:hypothetical protein BJ138DRAFT_425752 [Hygrophoropsis aurantiaca]
MAHLSTAPPLDANFYKIGAEELSFFKSSTGIQDDDALKEHILIIQEKAYAVAPYPCIRLFAFTELRISNHPVYRLALKLGRERKDAILLDIGCCFGNDVRKAVADGFPVQNVLAMDLVPDLWDLGHEMFKTTPGSFPAHFIAGDAFDPDMLSIEEPLATTGAGRPREALDLSTFNSLNPLRGRLSAIHAASLFHLFDEEKQRHLAHALAGLLSPEPNSVIFGAHRGAPKNKVLSDVANATMFAMFCHSPDSWVELWDGDVFPRGTVRVEATLKDVVVKNEKAWMLVWSVTRL